MGTRTVKCPIELCDVSHATLRKLTFNLFLLILVAYFASLTITFNWEIAVREYRSRFKDPGVIRDYLNSYSIRKLQLGAGTSNPAGWLNTDVNPSSKQVYLDATDRYPFPDGSFQYVFSEHLIEHIPWEGGMKMLKECYRILARGGKIRIVTPNLTKFIQLLNGPPDPDAQRFIIAKLKFHGWADTPVTRAYIFNRQVYEFGHRFLYDSATLRKTLELAGFKEITEYPVEEKTHPVFQEAELRTRNPGSNLWVVNKWESMAFEAVR